MFGLFRPKPWDRDATLRRAEEFRSRGKPKKAVAQLRQVLERDPRDATAHGRLAPLLLQLGRHEEALLSLRVAADDFDARGFGDKSLSLWLQIAQAKVTDLDAWQKVVQFHVAKGRKAEGVKVLLQAAAAQAGREGRPRAIVLLQDALLFEPRHLEATLGLAKLLVKERRRDEARALLDGATGYATGAALARVRRTTFVLFPGFRTFWRWLRG